MYELFAGMVVYAGKFNAEITDVEISDNSYYSFSFREIAS